MTVYGDASTLDDMHWRVCMYPTKTRFPCVSGKDMSTDLQHFTANFILSDAPPIGILGSSNLSMLLVNH